jgi:hypothetical protein
MAVYTLWFSLVWLVRAHRWAYLLRPLAEIPKRESLAVGLVGAAAVVLAPLRLGELARPYLIDGRGVRFAQGAGIVGAERVVDGVVLASLLMLGLLGSTALSPLPDHLGDLPMPVAAIPRAAWTSLAIFACAFLAMAAFYFARERASRVVHTLVGAVSPRLATFVATSVARVADGLTFLTQPRHALPYLRDTVVYWLMNVAGLFYVMRAGGLPATPAHAAVLMGVLSLGIMVPSGPGFFGAFQLSAYCGLALFFPLPQVVAEGSAIVFVLYASQTLVAIVFGLLGLLLLPASTLGRPLDRTSLDTASPLVEKLARTPHFRQVAAMSLPSRRRVLSTLLVVSAGALVGSALTLSARNAEARAGFDSPYSLDQTFNAALRLVRVDRGYKVTEKDQGAGYVLFEYRSHESGDRVSAGSVEMVPAGGIVKVVVQLQGMPRYHEQVLADALEKKLREEYGAPPPKKPVAPDGGAGGAGGAGGSAGGA